MNEVEKTPTITLYCPICSVKFEHSVDSTTTWKHRDIGWLCSLKCLAVAVAKSKAFWAKKEHHTHAPEPEETHTHEEAK